MPLELDTGRIGITHGVQVKGSDKHAVGVEAGIGFLCIVEAADKQSRATEQKQGERNLGDDQAGGKARLVQAAGGVERLVLQDRDGGQRRGAHRRNDAGDRGRKNGHHHGGQQHRAIQIPIDGKGKRGGRQKCGERFGRPVGAQHRNAAAGQGDDEVFDHELPHQTPAACAHG